MELTSLAGTTLTVEWAALVTSSAVGLVFVYAAGSKLLDFSGLVLGIRGFCLLSDRIAVVLAVLLIVSEGLIGLAHLAAWYLEVLVPATVIVLGLFLIAVAKILRRGEERPCLCFGAGRDESVDAFSILRIGILLAVEVALFLYVLRNSDGSLVAAIGARGIIVAGVAIPAVLLTSWCLSIHKFFRAWRVIFS